MEKVKDLFHDLILESDFSSKHKTEELLKSCSSPPPLSSHHSKAPGWSGRSCSTSREAAGLSVPGSHHGPALDLLGLPEVAVLLTDHHEVVDWRLSGGLATPDNDLPLAEGEGVPPEALPAGADRSVVVDLTVGVLTAGSDAGVPAVVVEAGEADGTLAVVFTFSLPA